MKSPFDNDRDNRSDRSLFDNGKPGLPSELFNDDSDPDPNSGSGPGSGDSDGGDDRASFDPRRFLKKLVLLGIILGLGYLVRPIFHDFIYWMAYSPFGILAFGVTGFVGLLLYLMPPLHPDPDSSSIGTVRSILRPFVPLSDPDLGNSVVTKLIILSCVFVLMFSLGIAYAIPAGMFEQRTLAQETMADAEQLDEFPAINEENARVIPKQVADTQTHGSVSYRTHQLGSSDIARMEDGRLSWSYPIIPETIRNVIFEHQRGIIMTDMTQMNTRQIQAHDTHEFRYGEGMALTRHIDWQLKKQHFMTTYKDDAVEFMHEGEPYMLYTKTGHEWRVNTNSLPHPVPVWDGVALVHEDGTVEHMTIAEAQEHPVLEGQRLYPLYNTQQEMAAMDYRNGIKNTTPFGERNYVEVAELPEGTGNSQPFVIDLDGERMSYVTAMSPQGEGPRGLDEVWFADARTGEYRYYASGSEPLGGIHQAMGSARSSDTQTGWGDDFVVLEPVPTTVNGELWWHVKVVPADHTVVSRNVFVNAHSGEAVQIYDDQTITQFLAGENPEAVERVTTEQAGDEPGVAYYVVVIGEDGTELDRIPIEEGQDVNIVSEAGNQTAGGNQTASGGGGA